MFNFFIKQTDKNGNTVKISGADYNHIKNVLRMQVGDQFLVSCDGVSSLCVLDEFIDDSIIAKIKTENYQDTSLPVQIYLFQGLPKSDKLELIIQKTVELGVTGIYPVEMARSIVKLDQKKKESKTARWQAIAESAAKQSKLSFIPTVYEVLSFNNAIKLLKDLDLILVPYENKDGMSATLDALTQIKRGMKIGVVIGPEGGFEDAEILALQNIGGKTISLGKRILRTETAAITTLSILSVYTEIKL